MVKYGLIGYPLKHSFSKKYFSEKFASEGLHDHHYELYELESIGLFETLLADHPDLKGLNVTIPYKEKVIPFLDKLDSACASIGAVNVIKITASNKRIGFNTDYLGFKTSLENWLNGQKPKALILGSGGASKAVRQALWDMEIEHLKISRTQDLPGTFTYKDLHEQPEILESHTLIINTTPLGTFPKTEEMPDIPVANINSNHRVYDLVYNPEKTFLMRSLEARGALVKNGLEMLHLQAEAAWKIWND